MIPGDFKLHLMLFKGMVIINAFGSKSDATMVNGERGVSFFGVCGSLFFACFIPAFYS